MSGSEMHRRRTGHELDWRMTDAPLAPEISAPPTLAGVGKSLFQIAYDLAAGCLWRSIVWLPVSLAMCVAVSLLATLITAWPLVIAGLDWTGWVGLAFVALFHLTAGIVWGVQRTLDRSAKEGLAILDLRLAELIDLLLAPLVRLGDGRMPQMEVTEVRDYLRQTSAHLVGGEQNGSSWRLIRRLTGFVTRWWLRAEIAMVEGALAAFERRGEKQISLTSLKNVVRDETLARGRTLALANLWQAELVVAAIVFMLLLVPAAMATFLA